MPDKNDNSTSKSKNKATTKSNLNNTLISSNTQFKSESQPDELSGKTVLPFSEVHICTSKKIKDLQSKKNFGDVKKVEKISRRRHKDAKDKFLMDNPDNLTIFILPSDQGPSITTYNFSEETSIKKKKSNNCLELY